MVTLYKIKNYNLKCNFKLISDCKQLIPFAISLKLLSVKFLFLVFFFNNINFQIMINQRINIEILIKD